MSVTGTGILNFSFTHVGGSSPTFVASKDIAQISVLDEFTSGTGAGQVDRMYRGTLTVNSGGGTQNIDLAGTLTDAFGATVTFAKVKGIILRNNGTVAVTLKPAAANAWTALLGSGSTLVIPAGAASVPFLDGDGAGHAVSAGSDTLTLQNDGGSATTVDVIIIGTSA